MGASFNETLRRFESWLRVEKNLSPRTREAYLYDLSRFRDFHIEGSTNTDIPLTSLAAEDLRRYVHHLREERGLRATTLSRAISSLRAYFEFAVEQRFIEENPAAALSSPKQTRKLPVYLAEGELRKLFESPDVTTPLGVRDRALLVAMAFCGMRLQELVGLNMNDLNFESRTVRVLGKGSRERLIPMNPTVERALLEWLQLRNPAEGEKAVFLNRMGRRLGGRMVEKLVSKYVTSAGISKSRLSPHKLRHTFATLLHAKDVDLVEIQTLLGHASIATTQIYTHTDKRRLEDAVEKLAILDKPA